ncbi:DUF2871 domain-containing protein [Staphylococcus massiliensis]|uniref:DUF2871 domain-containing protein n=1 Tax=Staphylococcus massiliensis S46 TaxID=1229783 RepID=K9AU79_9STAP|nr:DUF2871 domain-containing protein [Staphylococcus massiliensis]EKU45015.1 hypothetical protein C273_11859 [Staphylococcus massiliensis S46]MCG3400625.1 DUF2871 domain-containing protein [Staphylococcus massiliensis]MCG3402389.1 DUF2871 domain-containing protein [Staphylococcus massiliensis]MCG3411647.1 DUF2871 domain-containing protein [Staphylococcus massiliensis]PNZ99359.1 DUF2871 domain-containing protein [Staphylococcus massiliensis CCUG 55927]
MKRILYAFFTYTMLGLFSGFFYREFTVAHHFTGDSQLSIVHTHLLTLGMFMFLMLIPIEHLFKLSSYTLFNWFYYIYNIGVLTTIAMQFANGINTVLGNEKNPALSGISGLGHIALTGAFIVLFFLLRQAIIKNPRNKAK